MQLNNGQKCPASFDLFDKKDKPFAVLPAGASISVVSSDTSIAQWVPDADPDNGRGTITTEGDNVGSCSISGTLTLADGNVLSDVLPVEVIHSAPGTFRVTAGTPEDE